MLFLNAGILNYISAMISIGFGLIYLLNSSFLKYHQDAVRRSWHQLEPDMQALILALMRAISGGALLLGFVIVVLQWQYDKTHATWIPLTILLSSLIMSVCSFYAMSLVRTRTSGRPPIAVILLSVFMVLIAYLSDPGFAVSYPIM